MFWFIPRIVSFREAIGIKKNPDWIVCGIIPDTILIINSHPLSSVVHFPLVSFNSIVAFASMPICIPTIPTMHNFDASNSFRCCYCTLNIAQHGSFSFVFNSQYCSVCMTMNWWKYQTKEIIFHMFTMENNSMEIFWIDWKQYLFGKKAAKFTENRKKWYSYILYWFGNL